MSKVAVLDEAHGVTAAAAQIAAIGGFHNPTGKLVTKWDIHEVCTWLRSAGFEDVVPYFMKHQISGPVLPKLTDAILKEIGVDLVGRRVLLMNEICKVQALARSEWRNAALWSATQYREGPCNNVLPYGWPFSCDTCVGLPDNYTLTNSKLNITRNEKNCNTPCTGFCGFTINSDNFDLSDISDVDVQAMTAAWGEKAGSLLVSSRTGCYRLVLKSSECQKAAMLITNAKEEAAALIAAQTLSMVR